MEILWNLTKKTGGGENEKACELIARKVKIKTLQKNQNKGEIFMLKRVLAIAIAIACLMAATSLAFALTSNNNSASNLEKAISDYVCQQVIESYSEYYTIPNIAAKVTEISDNGVVINAVVSVNFTKLLLAQSASDLPYIKGLEDEAAMIKDASERTLMGEQIAVIKADLEGNYIGVEQPENTVFNIEIPSSIANSKSCISLGYSSNVTLRFQQEEEELDISEFAPSSSEDLYLAGKNRIVEDVEKLQDPQNITPTRAKTNPSSATDYNRITARDYVRQYSCGNCTTSPHACRNTNYYFFNGADCTNFVSQAIYAGGIQQESNWKQPNSSGSGHTSSWSVVNDLCNYMKNQGFFFQSTDKMKAFAGSIIRYTDGSHLMMVDANDTVTMTYCAHTNDRKSSSFKSLTGVDFCVPVWDSYSNCYAQQ